MNEKTTGGDGPGIDGAFVGLLQNHRKGGALSDLSAAVREVVDAVRATGKGGAIAFKIKVRSAAKSGAMIVEDEIKITLPKTEAEGSIFFADGEGNLLREDPEQRKLDLRTVESDKPEARESLKQVRTA